MLKFSVNGIVGNVWFLCNTDLKYRLLASTKLNLAFFCVRKLNLHFVAICPTCSNLQECPTVQISKSPGQAAWWIFTGMKIRIWNKSCSSVLLEAPSEDDISESKGKMLTIPEECCHGSIAQIPCQCPITLIARSYQLSDGRAEMKKDSELWIPSMARPNWKSTRQFTRGSSSIVWTTDIHFLQRQDLKFFSLSLVVAVLLLGELGGSVSKMWRILRLDKSHTIYLSTPTTLPEILGARKEMDLGKGSS